MGETIPLHVSCLAPDVAARRAQTPSGQIRGFGRGRGFGGYPLEQPQAPGDWGQGWPFFYSLSRSGVGG